MRILESNNIEIPVRATSMARLYYTQEFEQTLDTALRLMKHETDEQTVMNLLLTIVWAMNKAENMACKKSTPTFTQWVKKIDGFDVNDCAVDLFDEIRQGFAHKSMKSDVSEKEDPNLPQMVITIALKMGMSLDELNELTTQSLLNIFKIYSGKADKSQERRFATPSEISQIYGK